MDSQRYDDFVNLGNILLRQDKVTKEGLQRAIEAQNLLLNGSRPLIGEMLVQMGECSSKDIDDALEYQAITKLSQDNGKLEAAKRRLEKELNRFETNIENIIGRPLAGSEG